MSITENNVGVFDFCPRAFIDLINTTSGFKKRYGFVYVGHTDTENRELIRYKEDSFYWYQKVIESNGKKL